MGLDVYLKRFENYAASQRLKAEYERRMDLAWEQMANRRNDDEISSQEEEIYWQQCQKIARTIGLDSNGEDPLVQTIRLPSHKYPDHKFKIGYFYSSNNDSGINRILSDAIGIDLHSIFNPLAEEDFQPDWAKARDICLKAITDFTTHIEQHPYGVVPLTFDPYISPTQAQITSKALALQKLVAMKEQRTDTQPNNFGGWAGDFFLTEPLEVLAVIPGTAGFLERPDLPCFYIVFQHKHLDFYLQALEVVLETIEYVLEQPDIDKYYLDWSS
ncbi:MAG: hypothetical protein H0U45_16345 [Tatlockia sp.]|nr:hypothetical protein [Tatlockia sp.]